MQLVKNKSVEVETELARRVRRRETSLSVVVGVFLLAALWMMAIAWLVDVFSGRVLFPR